MPRHHFRLPGRYTYILRFDHIKKLYSFDYHFCPIFSKILQISFDKFYLSYWYLFYKGLLCIPNNSIRPLLVTECHEGSLMGHHGVDKTLSILKNKFFLPRMRVDVQNIVRNA